MSDKKEQIKNKIAKLYLKEGRVPNDSGLQDWYDTVKKYLKQGFDHYEAGKKAAKDIFPSFEDKENNMVFNSTKYEGKSVRASHTQSVMVLMQELEGLIRK